MKSSLTPIREYEQAVYVYWLGPGLPTVKIGHTNNPARRLEEFRRETGTPGHKASFAAIVWLDRHRERVEQAAHRTAGKYRRDGEWFALSASDAIDHVVAAAKANGIRYEVEDWAGIWAETIAQREREATDAEIVRLEAEYTATIRRRQLEFLAGCTGSLCSIIKLGAPPQYDFRNPESFKKHANDVLRLSYPDEANTSLRLEYYVTNRESFILAVEENAKRRPVEDTPQRTTAERNYLAANIPAHTASPFQLALGAVLAGDKAEARRRQIHRDKAAEVCIFVSIVIRESGSYWQRLTDPSMFKEYAYSVSKSMSKIVSKPLVDELPVDEDLFECLLANHDAFILAVSEQTKRPEVKENSGIHKVRCNAEWRESIAIFANPDTSFGTSLFPLAMRIVAAGDKAVLDCTRPFWARIWG